MNISHIDQVVSIHMICLPENQSTKYGKRFLNSYYKGICDSKNTVAHVYIVEEKVVGFVIGGINKQVLSRQILFHSKFKFLTSIIINILKNPKVTITKYWMYAKNYILPREDSFYSDKTAALDSTAVLAEFRGKGVAEKLTDVFLENLKNQKISACRLGVKSANTRARKFYEKMGFEQTNEEGTSYIYFFDDIYRNKFEKIS